LPPYESIPPATIPPFSLAETPAYTPPPPPYNDKSFQSPSPFYAGISNSNFSKYFENLQLKDFRVKNDACVEDRVLVFKYIFVIRVSLIIAPVRQWYVEKSTKCSEQKCASSLRE
jgi:hypothetical protein